MREVKIVSEWQKDAPLEREPGHKLGWHGEHMDGGRKIYTNFRKRTIWHFVGRGTARQNFGKFFAASVFRAPIICKKSHATVRQQGCSDEANDR